MTSFPFEDAIFAANCFGPPAEPGVYMVTVTHPETKRTKILYIGSSKDIQTRVRHKDHPYNIAYKRFRDYWVVTMSVITTDYIEFEKRAIAHFRPTLNRTHKPKING